MQRGFLAISLALATLLAAKPARAEGSGVTDFGGDPERQFRADSPIWSAPAYGWSQIPLGASIAQPLVVGDRIYVLAGDDLYLYDAVKLRSKKDTEQALVTTFSRANGRPLNGGYASMSHPVYSEENGTLYVGTGRRTVAVLDPVTLRLLGETPDLGADVVSSPLTFPGDMVVVGTRSGYLHVFHGLKQDRCRVSGDRACWKWRWLGGNITGAATRRGPNSFVIATDGPGEVMAFRLAEPSAQRPFTDAWEVSISGLAGIPDSPAVEGNTVFIVDKAGVFYKVSKNSGKLLAPPLRDGFARSFYNTSPSIGDRFVYFTRRGDSDAGAGDGYLVAVDKTNWQVAWKSKLPGQGNTSPLFWRQAGLVLVGDVEGYLSGWDVETGEPKPWAIEADPAQKIQAFRVTGLPQKDAKLAWTHLQGVGTEITVANGLLVVGANSPARPTDPNAVQNRLTGAWLSGLLFVAHTGYAANVSLTNGSATPSPTTPGASVVLAATARFATTDPKAPPLTTQVAWRWQGEAAWRQSPVTVTIPPNGDTPVSIPITTPNASAMAEVAVNPDRLNPAWETNDRDNILHIPVRVATPQPTKLPNIQVELEVPVEVPAGTRFPVPVVLIHDLDRETNVAVTFSVNGEPPTQTTVRLTPGHERQVLFELTAAGPGRIQVTGCANLDRHVAERDYADNCQTTDFPVAANPGVAAPDRIRVRLVR